MSTTVEKVALNFGMSNQKLLDRMTLTRVKKIMKKVTFRQAVWSLKIQAINNFLEMGGEEAIVTNPENIKRALLGEAGTCISK